MSDPEPETVPVKTEPQLPQRVRIHFAKGEEVRYIGHLDLNRIWERTLRRSRLPVAYSHGFNPQIRFSLACALPLGFTSQTELLDLWLEKPTPLQEILLALQKAVTPGIVLLDIEEVDYRAPALQTQILASEYEVTFLDAPTELDVPGLISPVLAASSLHRLRRGKEYDLRPLIEELKPMTPDEKGHPRLFMRLSAREGATGRPEEVLDVMGIPPTAARVHRIHLILPDMVF